MFCSLLNQVAYKPTPAAGVGLLAGLPGGSAGGVSGWRGVLRSVVRGLVTDVSQEVVAEIASVMNNANSVEKRYMVQDDSADRIQMKD